MPLTAQGLYAPPSYLDAPPDLLARVCNGCGSARAKFDFVPDTIYCLPIGAACLVHDWMYHCGRTAQDKLEADVVFLGNLLRLIERPRGVWHRLLRPLRRLRALHYYQAVAEFGGPAFYTGKP